MGWSTILWRAAPVVFVLFSAPLPAQDVTVSFSKQVLPLLVRECGYCHMREERYGYLVIDPETAYANLVGVPARGYPALSRVEPGAPGQSYLWLKMTGEYLALGGEGWSMPYFPLGDEKKELIRRWIEQGAAEN